MFDDQELYESIQAFREIGAEIELQPILAFLAATRARTVRDGSAVQRQQPAAPDPRTAMREKIAEISADKSLAATDKKELLDEFEKRLNAVEPIEYPSNIELVEKYYDQIHPIRR